VRHAERPGRSPDFIIVGAPRSGSTFLMRNLMCRPDVYMPPPEGEHSTGDIHFFDVGREEGRRRFQRGLSWYRSLFAEAAPHQACGEKTADYLADEEACRRIHASCEGVKIVALLREPLQRARSHFLHERHNLRGYPSLEALFEHGSDIGDARVLSSSFYADSVHRYLERFGAERVLVVVFEDLVGAPERELARVSAFLNLSPGFDYPLRDAVINRAVHGRWIGWTRRMARTLAARSPAVHARLASSAPGRLLKSRIARRRATGSYAARTAADVAPACPAEKEFVAAFRRRYRPDVVRLSALLRRDMQRLWWERGTLEAERDTP